MIDLWPNDIHSPTVKAPVSILKEQASLLGEKTDNLVEAKVRNLTKEGGSTFHYQFFLESSTIGYSYRVLAILYAIDFYPVAFVLDSDIQQELEHKGVIDEYKVFEDGRDSIKAQTEEQFINLLGEILKSNKTRRIILALLAQVEAGVPKPDYYDIPF